jgi:hypothetical protein
MKTLKQITLFALLLVQTIGFSQTKSTETAAKKVEPVQKNEKKATKIDTKNLKKFIGTYNLAEANFTLDIVQENDKMYIVTEFSKDQLLLKDEITLTEFTRGVDLQLIEGNKNALKFSQNGYITTIDRVKPKTKK